MREAASHFIGVHDFSSFSASRGKEEEFSKIRKVWKVDILERCGELQFLVEGEGFLYKMVRSMVGALWMLGLGNSHPRRFREILESRKRTERIVSSPAKGLCLRKSILSYARIGKVNKRWLRIFWNHFWDVIFPGQCPVCKGSFQGWIALHLFALFG